MHQTPPIAPACFEPLLRSITSTIEKRGADNGRIMVQTLAFEYERMASGLDALFEPDKLDTMYKAHFGASRADTRQLLRYLRQREQELSA